MYEAVGSGGQRVALKVFDPHRVSPWVKARIEQEGRVASRLNHPSIVRAHRVFDHDGAPVIAMDLVDGVSLREWAAANHPVPPDSFERIARDVLSGLAYAHAQGVVHRDITPANILVNGSPRDVRARVTDFGLVKALTPADASAPGTVVGVAMGTPGFMPLEQLDDASTVDARADIFALGAVLFELWSGAPAFPDDPAKSRLQRLSDQREAILRGPTPLSALRADTPRALHRTISRCLEARRDDRFASAGEVEAALFSRSSSTIVPESLAPAEEPTTPATPQSGATRRPPPDASAGVAALVASGVGFVAAGFGLWVWFGRAAGPPGVSGVPVPTGEPELTQTTQDLPVIDVIRVPGGRYQRKWVERVEWTVEVTSFCLARTEIDRAEWFAVEKTCPWVGPGACEHPESSDLPAANIGAADAQDWVVKRSERDGRAWRLPTLDELRAAAIWDDDERRRLGQPAAENVSRASGRLRAPPAGPHFEDLTGSLTEWTQTTVGGRVNFSRFGGNFTARPEDWTKEFTESTEAQPTRGFRPVGECGAP